jgi:membrane-bound lytic murein transglycosylase A
LGAVAAFGAPVTAAHRLEPLGFEAIAGFRGDDLVAAFRTFRASCRAIVAEAPELRGGKPASAALRALCADALAARVDDNAEAARFFESRFSPHRIVVSDAQGVEQRGFLTGYYEPIVEASRTRAPDFPTPVLSRPDDLVTLDPGDAQGALAGLAAARRTPDGALEPYPDRAAIETGALKEKAPPVAWLRDPVERFLIQVQGSARLRFPDGSAARLTYAGRNGLPYTSIGKILVEEGHVPAERMSLATLKQWLRDHGQDDGSEGARVMRRNRSFVFFRLDSVTEPATGPIGAAGVALTPLRSIAVDRAHWSYGLPFWIAADIPWRGPTPTPFGRLMIAQDTGTAIIGPARADLFFGSGDEAGARAGDIRHAGDVIVLLPREATP